MGNMESYVPILLFISRQFSQNVRLIIILQLGNLVKTSKTLCFPLMMQLL